MQKKKLVVRNRKVKNLDTTLSNLFIISINFQGYDYKRYVPKSIESLVRKNKVFSCTLLGFLIDPN